MARQVTRSPLKRAAGAISRSAKKVKAKLRPKKQAGAKKAARQGPKQAAKATQRAAQPAMQEAALPPQPRSVAKAGASTRPRIVPADIPIELVESAYTPHQTSLKASFRSNGEERQRDQELGRGVHLDRFNDEDHFTNKSGDARIGTHGRTYEPGEPRARK
jgi:hypothetical protein